MNESIKSILEITPHIFKYRAFLNIGYPYLENLMSDHNWDDDHSFINDWDQINWEFLIEGILVDKSDYLEPPQFHHRILKSGSHSNTYFVLCKAEVGIELVEHHRKKINIIKTTKEDIFQYCYLSTRNNTRPGLYPPFDLVNVKTMDGRKYYSIPFENCRFFLAKFADILSNPHD